MSWVRVLVFDCLGGILGLCVNAMDASRGHTVWLNKYGYVLRSSR